MSYAFSQQENRDIWKKHNPNRGDNLAAEMLLASLHILLEDLMKMER